MSLQIKQERLKNREATIKKVVMLFSMSFLPYQGRYLRVYNEARTLVEAGMDVTIIAWDRDCRVKKEEVIDGIKVERIWSRAGFQKGPSNIFSVLSFYFRLIPGLLSRDADVIHCFNLDTVLPGLLVAKVKRKKKVLDLCEPSYYKNWNKRYRFFTEMLQSFERFFSSKFDYVLVHNTYQMKKFRGYGVYPLEQIGSYPNSRLIADGAGNKIHPGDAVVLGRIGSIYKNNGIEEIVDVFKRLRSIFPGIKLLLAGKVFSEFEEEFRDLIAPLGEAVEVLGEFGPSDLPALYKKIDISIQLSRRTDWFKNITPTKFFETLAGGVPVLTSDIGDLRQIIEEYHCGVIVDETDPENIFAELKHMIEDPQLRLTLARNGLRAVHEKYNWDLMGEKLLSAYRSLGSLGLRGKSSDYHEARC